jgi:multidrug efflux pump subunit AcrA (membrane-fusion protein)
VNQGEYVRAEELLAEFQSSDNLILEGEYFGDQPLLSPDTLIQVILNDTLRAEGQLLFLEKAVNPQTGGRRFRVQFHPPLPKVQPGNHVKYRLQLSPFQAPAVPEEALIREKGKYYLIELHHGTTRVREVVPGARTGKFYQLIQGPAPGTRVLTTGAFQVFHARLKETMKIED